MSDWQQTFVRKLGDAQSRYQNAFGEAIQNEVIPAFEELRSFLTGNGFKLSMPLQELGRRSFKFELVENAYALLIFRFQGIGQFELRSETFAAGQEPQLEKSMGHVSDINKAWATRQFQGALDALVDLLAGRPRPTAAPLPDAEEELVVV